MTKFALRKKYQATRSQIPTPLRQEAGVQAAQLLANLPLFKQSQKIACYLPFKDEFDSSPVIEAIWKAKKHCYLPVLSEKEENALSFVRYEYGDSLRLNKFSILEPSKPKHIIEPQNLELVITSSWNRWWVL